MYDKHYLLDAIRGWKHETKDHLKDGFEELMDMVKTEYVKLIETRGDVRFFKNVALMPKKKVPEKQPTQLVEVSKASDNKVVVRKEHEVQISIAETEPAGGNPGIVAIRVDQTGVPVTFSRITDSGNHKSTLRHAKHVINAVVLSDSSEKT